MTLPVISKDPDTDKLLRIVVWNLSRFFGYADTAADALVRSFYARWQSPDWGDDFYHDEGAFRSSALMHYSELHGGTTDFTRFREWYWAQNFGDFEREALEYFREAYFDKH
jgi:hypothetical protein